MKKSIFVLGLLSSLANAQSYSVYPPKGGGTVTSIVAGNGLNGGTITGTGTISLSTPVSVANGGTGSTSYIPSPWLSTGLVTQLIAGQFYSQTYAAGGNINWNQGNTQLVQLTSGQNYSPTFSNPQDGAKYTLILREPASGSPAIISLPAAVHFTNVPTYSGVGYLDIVTMVYLAATGDYYAGFSLGYTP